MTTFRSKGHGANRVVYPVSQTKLGETQYRLSYEQGIEHNKRMTEDEQVQLLKDTLDKRGMDYTKIDQYGNLYEITMKDGRKIKYRALPATKDEARNRILSAINEAQRESIWNPYVPRYPRLTAFGQEDES